MLNPGDFKYMVDILEITTVQNEVLSDTKQLTKLCSVHAYVNSPSRRDNEQAGAENQEIDIIFTVRYSKLFKDILIRKQDFRVMFEGVVYKIKYTDNFKFKNETIRLSCKAVTKYSGKAEENPTAADP
jgi:SPP1 family predicted phage head-tail adaptor